MHWLKFHFYCILDSTSYKQTVETDQSSLSDLGLHCSPISQIYDIMLIVACATANPDGDACKPL